MKKILSIAIVSAIALSAAACGSPEAAETAPRKVRVEVAENPTITETRCFMRIKADGQVALIDFRKPVQGSILQDQQRNFEICEQARQGDIVMLDAGKVG